MSMFSIFRGNEKPADGLKRMLDDIEREVALTRHLIGKDRLDPKVMEALSRVPRHELMPKSAQAVAYNNGPASIGHGQTISQPYMVALMTDLLCPAADHVILEVGTGSGYQAAVLAQLVKKVYSIEIIRELAEAARERLQRLGHGNVEVRIGDGYYGWPEYAPFDGIVVTAAAPHIPEPLVEQLKPGGRLVIPVGLPYRHQELRVIQKSEQGYISTRDVMSVAFVPLTGGHNRPES